MGRFGDVTDGTLVNEVDYVQLESGQPEMIKD